MKRKSSLSKIKLFISLFIIGAGLSACTRYLHIETTPQIKVEKSTKESDIMNDIIQPYRKELDEKMNIEVASSNTNFVVNRPSSNLMNWMADVVFTNQTKNVKMSKPVFCLLNTGGIRSSIGIGPVYLGDLYKLMPFDNTIIWARLPIKELESIELYLSETGGEPISNITMTNGVIQFNGFDKTEVEDFWVITSDYLYNGGDHMDFFQKSIETVETNKLIRDVVIEEAKIQGQLINDENSRIK